MQASAFLDRFRNDVLALARKPLRELLGSGEVRSLIQRIEADDASAALMPPRRDMLRGEDAFWFCVMQLDEFGAIDWPGAIHEPFLHHLHHDLKRAAYCLGHGRDLPHGMIVHWMDEGDADDWARDAGGPEGLDSMFTVRQADPRNPGMLMLSMKLPDGFLEPGPSDGRRPHGGPQRLQPTGPKGGTGKAH